MKKIAALILCILMTFTAFGCDIDASYNLTMDDPQAWTATGYEKSVYAVTKKNGDGKVLGSGTLVLTVDVDQERTESSANNTKYSVTTASFTFTENGITDTIESKAVFIERSMFCVYSEKTAIYGGNNADKSYSFTCDYDGTKKAVFKTGATLNNETILDVSSLDGGIYDNETLYYLTRAFNAGETQYGNFLLTNLYDSYVAGAVQPYDIYYRVETDINLDDFTQEQLNSWGILETMGKLPTYKASVSINATLTGPAVEMWFSSPDKVLTCGNKKILAKIKTTTYAVPSSAIDYTTEFLLRSYEYTK